MAFTKVTAAGINTGGSFILENINTSGIITASTVNVGSAVTISSSGANVTGIVTAGTVQVGSATTIHTTGIDLGGGTLTSHNINSTGIITATSGFDGNLTGNVTGDLTGNVTGNVSSSGANTLGSLTVTNDATVGGALTVTGDFTVNGTTTTIDTIVTAVDSLAVDGNVTAGGNLDITGISTFQNDVNFAGATGVTSAFFDKSDNSLKFFDSTKAKFGTGNDLEIYHDGTHSHVREVGTGDLRLRSSKIQLMNPSSEPYFIGNSDGAVELYYDNSKKFETTGTGVTITGDARVTGILTVGTASVTIDGSQDFPTIRPTLDLNFAATKTLDRRITFTRDSIGTYIDELGVIKYAPNNVPRFDHDPDTGESLGLLIEESRTNSYTYSVDLSQSVYSKNNVTIVSNAAVAPDGTTTATKIVPSTSSVVHSISRIGTVGLNAIRSVYIKAGEYTSCVIDDINTGARATINLLDGSTSNTNYIPQRGNLVNAGNGWWRVYVGYDQYSAVNNPFHIYPNTNSAFAGDGTSGIYVWGYQQEADAWPLPSSYIPTSGSTVTRAQDFAKITGTNFTDFYNQEEGTLVCDQSVSDLSTANQYSVILSSSINESIGMGYRVGGGASGDYGFYIIKSGDALFRSVTANIAVDTPFRTALAYKLNDGGTCFNGGTAITDDTLVLPTPDRMLIGEGYSANNELTKGHIRKLTYYPKRLTNAQLQSLTRQ